MRVASISILAALLLGSCLPIRGQEIFSDPEMLVSADVEKLYQLGLDFLARSQDKNGSWAEANARQPGVVALALLAFLAHGEDPDHGPYRLIIRRGFDYLLAQQNKENGYIGSSMYNHAFSTLALAEAYGAIDDERLAPALQLAVKLLLSSQASNSQYAWRYSPDSNDADTTVSGACLMALFAARNAGLAIPDASIEQALKFFRDCQNGSGGFGYTHNGASSPPRAAIGTLMLAMAKQQQSRAYMMAAQHLRSLSLDAEEGHLYYFLYYASQAMFRGDAGEWNKWNAVNIKFLSSRQNTDGSWVSSQGVTFGTAMALLSLALNYRFLPIYER